MQAQRTTTKNPKKVEAGKRLAESNHKKREAKKQAKLEVIGVNQYYGIGAVLALGIIGGLGYQGRRNSRGHGRGTFWPISIFIYRKSIEVFYSLMSILI